MSQTCFSVRKLTPSIGGEIDGVDLAALSDHDLRDVRQALLDHLVIFFRNQKLTLQQQKEIGLHFGPLHIHPAPLGIVEGHPEIIVIEAGETPSVSQATNGIPTCRATSVPRWEPCSTSPKSRLLAATHSSRACTQHTMRSGSMQRFLSGLTAIHDGARNYEGRQPSSRPQRGVSFRGASRRAHAS